MADNELLETLQLILQKVDSMDTRIDSIDTRIDSIDTRIDSIDTRIDSIDKRQQEMAKDLNKTMIAVEGLQINQKAIIEGQQTATHQLEEKINEAVKQLKETDTTFELALKRIAK